MVVVLVVVVVVVVEITTTVAVVEVVEAVAEEVVVDLGIGEADVVAEVGMLTTTITTIPAKEVELPQLLLAVDEAARVDGMRRYEYFSF